VGSLAEVAARAVNALPHDGRAVKDAVRALAMQRELMRWRLQCYFMRSRVPDPRTVYWLAPRSILLHTCLKNDSDDWEDWVFGPRASIRTVQDGDWDISGLRVADMRICRAVADRINHGVPWQYTDFYKVAVRQIQGGRRLWRCTSRAAFDRRCEEIDRLVESIVRHGYRRSDQLDEEVLVNLSRHGAPLFQNGRHRLAIALALGFDQIPVQVLVRHALWQNFRERVRLGVTSGETIRSSSHFDLADVLGEG
jgi:hypothetical protein